MSDLLFGKDVEPLKQGLCWIYEKYVGQASDEIQSRYREAEAAAQSERAGLWQDPSPVPPWDWRKEKRANRNRTRVMLNPRAVKLFVTNRRDRVLSYFPEQDGFRERSRATKWLNPSGFFLLFA